MRRSARRAGTLNRRATVTDVQFRCLGSLLGHLWDSVVLHRNAKRRCVCVSLKCSFSKSKPAWRCCEEWRESRLFRTKKRHHSKLAHPPNMSSPAPVIIYSFVARGTTVLCENSGHYVGNFSQVREGERESEKEIEERSKRWTRAMGVFFFLLLSSVDRRKKTLHPLTFRPYLASSASLSPFPYN